MNLLLNTENIYVIQCTRMNGPIDTFEKIQNELLSFINKWFMLFFLYFFSKCNSSINLLPMEGKNIIYFFINLMKSTFHMPSSMYHFEISWIVSPKITNPRFNSHNQLQLIQVSSKKFNRNQGTRRLSHQQT